MARHADLPELELLPLDEVDEDDGAPVDDTRPASRGWAVAALALAAVGLLGLSGVAGREDRAVEVFPVPTTAPPSSTTARRPRPMYAVPAEAGDAVLVSSGSWAGEIRIPAGLGTVRTVATGRTFVVVGLSTGEVRRYSREEPSGTPLGEADAVIPNAGDRSLVWAVATVGDHQVVRTIMAAPMTQGILRAVPAGWQAVGSTDGFLVLARAGAGVALWDVWAESAPVLLDGEGRFVASSRRTVAWRRDGIVVMASRPYGDVSAGLRTTRVAVPGDLVAGRFAPDGEHLAVVGPARGGYAVHLLSSGNYDRGFLVPVTVQPSFGWDAEGELVVAAGSVLEHRYDPDTDALTSNGRSVVAVPPTPLPLPS